jgi:hypothetical protein
MGKCEGGSAKGEVRRGKCERGNAKGEMRKGKCERGKGKGDRYAVVCNEFGCATNFLELATGDLR